MRVQEKSEEIFEKLVRRRSSNFGEILRNFKDLRKDFE